MSVSRSLRHTLGAGEVGVVTGIVDQSGEDQDSPRPI